MTSLDLAQLSGGRLAAGEDGVFRPRARAASRDVSFPDEGHRSLMEVEDASFWFSHRSACIAAALAAHGAEGPVLDVGGGNGVVARALADAGFEVAVVEPGEVGAHNARSRGLPAACATLEESGFAEASFGVVGAFDVIEHVADPGALLARMRTVLRPGGLCAVTVPAYSLLWSEEDVVAGHHRRYTLEGLERALFAERFEVLYATYLFAALLPPVFALRSVPHWLRQLTGRGRGEGEALDGAAAQHVPGKASRVVMDALLAPELARVRARKSVPAGTSCLAIARAR